MDFHIKGTDPFCFYERDTLDYYFHIEILGAYIIQLWCSYPSNLFAVTRQAWLIGSNTGLGV